MIRARIRYPNGQAIMRQGTMLINACLAQGLKIVRSVDNRLPEGIYSEDSFETDTDQPEQPKKRGPGRPRIHRP